MPNQYTTGAVVSTPLIARFWAKVDKDGTVPTHRPELGPCWLWTGGTFKNGYGSITYSTGLSGRQRSRSRSTHRLSWEIHHDTKPVGWYVLHHCDVRRCVRPDHLFLGTHAANVRDMVEKGRNVLPAQRDRRGERNTTAKYSEATIRALKARFAQGGITRRALALEYDMPYSTVRNILSGRIWKHIA